MMLTEFMNDSNVKFLRQTRCVCEAAFPYCCGCWHRS